MGASNAVGAKARFQLVTIISYAQNFEDVMLWRALLHVEDGFYIDIGAQDPIADSVSLLFHEHGWRGIHVEPVPHFADLLRQRRPGDTVIQAVVGEGPAFLPFFEISGTGISTADRDIAAQHRARGFEARELVVPCVSLASILEMASPKEVHWLKIDVEGFEANLLTSWGSSDKRPWVVVVESTMPMTRVGTQGNWEHLLTERGYGFVYFDGLNRFYIHESHADLSAAFALPPNLFDDFAFNGTASSGFHTTIAARAEERLSLVTQEAERVKSALEEEVKAIKTQILAHDAERAELEERLNVKNREIEQLLREGVIREAGHSDHLASVQEASRQQLMKLETRNDAKVMEVEQLLRDAITREAEHFERIESIRKEARHQIMELEARHGAAMKDLETLKVASEQDLISTNVALGSALDALQRTISWRITAPFRFVADWIKGRLPSRGDGSDRTPD